MPDFVDKDLPWLAGFLEGEGSFDLTTRNLCPRIRVSSTDLDVVIRAASIMGCVSVNYMTRPTNGNKLAYATGISGERAVMWMKVLLPMMGVRRQEQIDQCLDKYAERGHSIKSQPPKRRITTRTSNLAWANPLYERVV